MSSEPVNTTTQTLTQKSDLSYLNSTHPESTVYDEKAGTNALLMVISTGMILFMQAGFALVENGSVRQKNSKNILIKNMFDVCIGAILFWIFGYSFAFGEKPSLFIGGDKTSLGAYGFDQARDVDHYATWIFQFSFAATAATIVSGSLAERTRLPTYIVYSALMTGFIYPVVVAWTWGQGWLSKLGFSDFAGTGIVHMVGGVAGFVGSAILGPRLEKQKDRKQINIKEEKEVKKIAKSVSDPAGFEQWIQEAANSTAPYEPNSIPFMVIGTIILWVAWLFFNGGSTVDMYVARNQGTPKIMMNTIISGATGGLISVGMKPLIFKNYSHNMRYDIGALCNGVLGGLVSITGACNNVQPLGAFFIGLIGGLVYCLSARLCDLKSIDDPIEASAVHGFCGMWGLIAVGLFDNDKGLFTGGANTANFYFFSIQLLGMVAIIVWVALLSAIFFSIVNYGGLFRVSLTEELLGLDIAEMDADSIPHINEQVQFWRVKQLGLPRSTKIINDIEDTDGKQDKAAIDHI